jgi:hypothetical protein
MPGLRGLHVSYRCARCGHEGKLHARHLCTRCTFADRLAELLDDGTDRIRPELAPLADSLLAMDNPLSARERPTRPSTCCGASDAGR